MSRAFTLILLCSGLASQTWRAAAATTDEDMCRNGLFPSQLNDVRIASFEGEARSRLYFFDDMDGCPAAGARCQTKSYVVPGDEIIVGKRHGDWSCAWYSGRKHETVGWVPNRQLHVADTDRSPDWHGTWKEFDYPGYISVTRKAGQHYVLGSTKWTGPLLADGERVEHLGDFAGVLRVEGDRASFGPDAAGPATQYQCAVDMVRIGRYLIVHDNAQCGGVNVRFNGVYTKAKR